MINVSYSQLIKRICSATKLSEEEVERRILEKKTKLSDLISKEGAAQIIAAELGVSFDGQKLPIKDLISGMRKASLSVKIIKISPAREFQTKKGAQSKVMNLIVADKSGSAKCVIWDVNLIKEIEEGKIKEGDVVEIKDSSIRENFGNSEVHLGSYSSLSLSNEIIEEVKLTPDKEAKEVKLKELREGMKAKGRAVIVQAFDPKVFYVCPECNKRATLDGENFKCITHGKVIPQERALMAITLDDGTANLRAVLFGEVIKDLFSGENLDIKSISLEKRNELLGKELIFEGRPRKNPLYGTMEFVVTKVSDINLDSLIEKMSHNVDK